MQVVVARCCFDDTKVSIHTFCLSVDFKIRIIIKKGTEVLCFRALS